MKLDEYRVKHGLTYLGLAKVVDITMTLVVTLCLSGKCRDLELVSKLSRRTNGLVGRHDWLHGPEAIGAGISPEQYYFSKLLDLADGVSSQCWAQRKAGKGRRRSAAMKKRESYNCWKYIRSGAGTCFIRNFTDPFLCLFGTPPQKCHDDCQGYKYGGS